MEEKEVTGSNAVLWAVSFSLNFFWILNILKESFAGVKNFLNFYPPDGPLLGLFIFSILVFMAGLPLFNLLKISNQKSSFIAMLISSILFFFMVFPPVFQIFVKLLK